MQITHEQAQRLIQLNLDEKLKKQEAILLSGHLRDCNECQVYANEMKEVETILLPMMREKWNFQSAPLSIEGLIRSGSSILNPSTSLTIRKAAIGLLVMGLFFSAWQYIASGISPNPLAESLLSPVPTPSSYLAQSTRTEVTFENCEMMLYTVTELDTLASIALQFSVSEEEIMAINDMETNAIHPAMELAIPICNSTPTGTVYPETLTTTFTPGLRPRSSTPGPSG